MAIDWTVLRLRLCPAIAVGAIAIRSAVHGIMALTEVHQPETAIAAIMDLPTMLIYLAMSAAGYSYDVNGFIDLRFFIVGTATWFGIGLAFGWLVDRSRRRDTGTRQLE